MLRSFLCHVSVLLCIACLNGPFYSKAQDYVVSFRHWDMTDGLVHRQVNSTAIDKDGFMWLATANGLSLFDGYNFKSFSSENAGLPFNDIRQVLVAPDGLLWLLGYNGIDNICVFDPHTRKAHKPRQYLNRYIENMFQLSDERLLLGTSGPDHQWYIALGDTAFKHLPGIPSSYVPYCFMPGDLFWLGDGNGNMYEVSLSGEVLQRWKLRGAYIAANSGLFIKSRDGSKLYEVLKNKQLHELAYVPPPNPLKLDFIGKTGIDDIIWRQGRLFHPTKGELRNFPEEGWNDLEGSVRMVMVSAPGDLWIGGSFGLYNITIRHSRFKKYFFDPSRKQIVENGYRGLLTVDGKLLGAQDRWGIFSSGVKSNDSGIAYPAAQHNSTRFTELMRLKDSSLLFVSHTLLHAADKHGRYTGILGHTGPLPVWCVYEWDSLLLLLGTEQGLEWFNTKDKILLPFTTYNGDSSLREGTVNSITPMADGTLCICAGNGLYIMDRKNGIVGHYSDDGPGRHYLPAKRFFRCLEEDNGRFWLSTATGLIAWNRQNGTYRKYTTNDGLSNNVIYAAYPDDKGRLWLPSDYGLMCFDKITGQVVTYLTEDGISSNEFNRISQFRDSDGTLYFGSINGVTAFNPADFGSGNEKGLKKQPAQLAITSFLQFNGKKSKLVDKTSELRQTHRIVLEPGDHYFSIELALLNYTAPEFTTYYWMIEDEDKKWNEQKGRTIGLSSPPFGRYKLHLMAKAGNGINSANEIVIDLYVPAPFYRTPQFLASIVVLLMCITGLLFYMKNRHTLQENRRLEQVVAQRTALLKNSLVQKEVLLKEVHHRVKNNLQTITSLQRLQSAHSTDPTVKAALEESQNRIMSIAFIHQNLYQQDEIQGVEMSLFINELTQHVAAVFGNPQTGISLHTAVPGMKLDIDTAVPVGLIINELLTNSYKYAFKGRSMGNISITLRSTGEGEYQMRYSDDGIGLPAGLNITDASSLGLRLVMQLAEQLYGKIIYNFDAGSNFTLSFFDLAKRNSLE